MSLNVTSLSGSGIVKVLWVILLYIREHIIYVSCFSALIQHLCYLKASVFCGSGSGSLDPGTHRHELFKGLFVKRQPLVQSLSQLKIILIEDIIIVAFNHTKPGKQIFLECLFSKLELVAKNFLDLNFGFWGSLHLEAVLLPYLLDRSIFIRVRVFSKYTKSSALLNSELVEHLNFFIVLLLWLIWHHPANCLQSHISHC